MNIYKFIVGDTVKFKNEFTFPTCGLSEFAGKPAKIIARDYFNSPVYKIDIAEGWYSEDCFAGKIGEDEPEQLKFDFCDSKTSEVGTNQGPELTCDTESSGESGFDVLPLEEAEWYHISFDAKLTPDDLRAMKKCFFDAMNESMEIYDLRELKLEKVED